MNNLKQHEITGLIRIEELAPGYPCIVVTNQHATAKIALHGAHVIDFTPEGEKPVIFTSADAIYKEGKAIRGGIPVCWPWFNAHPSDSTQPAHGFARNAFWQLFRSSNNDQVTTLIFTFSKHDLHAELTVTVGKELTVSIKTTNTGDTPEIIGGALHSYFTISDISNISITGLENISFHDSLTGHQAQEKTAIKIGQEVDRVYQDSQQTVLINDEQWNRVVKIEKSGSKSTVVWNPWIEKSASMADLGNQEYLNFVCIETANALKDVYSVSPGDSHTMTTKISTLPNQ